VWLFFQVHCCCCLTSGSDSMAGICVLCCSVFVTRHVLKSVSVIFIHIYFWNCTLNCLLCGTLLDMHTYLSNVDTSRKRATLSIAFICSLSYTYLKSSPPPLSPQDFYAHHPLVPHWLHCRLRHFFRSCYLCCFSYTATYPAD